MGKRAQPAPQQEELRHLVLSIDGSRPGWLAVDPVSVPLPHDPLTDPTVDPREQVQAAQQQRVGLIDSLYRQQVVPYLNKIKAHADDVSKVFQAMEISSDLGTAIRAEVNECLIAMDYLLGTLTHQQVAMERYTTSGAKSAAAGQTSQRQTNERRRNKAMLRQKHWQTLADEIWRQHPSLSKHRVAVVVAKRIKDDTGEEQSVNTIRQSILKPQL